MIIVSVADRYQWIDLCKASGAIAWQTAHNMTVIYEWMEPPLDENGMEIRPPNATGITGAPLNKDGSVRKDYNAPKKNYDRSALIDDIRAELLTYEEMSDRYGITRQTIYNIQKREGIEQNRLRKDVGKPRKQYNREHLVADIRANQMTYHELGQKYGLKAISVQRIARVEGLTKPRQRRKVNPA
jgi:transposase